MRHSSNLLLFVALTLLFGACSSSRPVTAVKLPDGTVLPKNVIFLIGDGMGLPQITGAMYMNNNKTVFEQFRNIGFHKSDAADNLVTDSAAGATAFASGVKTFNGAIGVNVKKVPVPTLLEMAEARGMATGLVATSSITHATPGSFIAHVDSREKMEDIALGFLDTEVDLFIGGGKDYFARRRDDRDLIAELIARDYQISDFVQQDIQTLNVRTKKNVGYFTANGEPLPVSLGRDYLVPAAYKALQFLEDRSPEGFFLMIEGSQIDWGGHANDAKYVISELHEFERAIQTALDFARKDKNTLVIVTSDHETGGFAVQPGSKLNDIEVAFTTKSHTALMVPIFAEGPGAEWFRGIYPNTDVFFKLKTLMNLPEITLATKK